MCSPATLIANKMYNDRKDRKSKQRVREKWSSAEAAVGQPATPLTKTDSTVSKAKPKTKMNTGINIGGQY